MLICGLGLGYGTGKTLNSDTRDPILEHAVQKHQNMQPGEKKSTEIQDDETLLDHLVKSTTGMYDLSMTISQGF